MNNDYGNYSRDLTRARENFNDTARKMRDAYDKSLGDIQESSLRRKDELKANHVKDKNKLIEENQEKLNFANEKTTKTIARQQQEFSEGLRSERENFGAEKNKLREGFQNKLANIKDSYENSFNEFKNQTDKSVREKEHRYNSELGLNKENMEKKITDIQHKTDSMIEKNNTDLEKQKLSILNNSQRDKFATAEDYKNNLEKVSSRLENKNKEVLDTKNNEIENLVNRYEDKLSKEKFARQNEVVNLVKNSSDENDDLQKNFQDSYKNLEAEHSRELKKLNNEVSMHKNSSSGMNAAEYSENKSSQANDNSYMLDSYEKKVDHMKKQMADQSVKYQRIMSENQAQIQDKVDDTLNDDKIRTDKRIGTYQKEIFDIEQRSKKSHYKNVEDFRDKLFENQKNSQLAINVERDTGKEKLESQRKDFGRTVNKLADLNIRNIERLQAESAKEKANIIENAKREYSDSLKDYRDDYRFRLDKTVESYDKKLSAKENALNEIRDFSEEKIADIYRNTQKQMMTETTYNKEVRDSDRKAMQEQLNDAKRDFSIMSKKLKADYDQSLLKIRKENDVNLSRLMKHTEDEKVRMQVESSKELKRINADSKQQFERYMKENKVEREQLIDHYERRIQEMKLAFDTDKIKASELRKA